MSDDWKLTATKAPWYVGHIKHNDGAVSIVNDEGIRVARVDAGPGSADAALIAAAPELLKQAKKARARLRKLGDTETANWLDAAIVLAEAGRPE